MKLTKTLVEDCIDEVLPKIENETQLKCNTNNLTVSLFNFKDYDEEKGKIKNYASYFLYVAEYDDKTNNIKIKESFLGNTDYLKTIVGHELMHNAQHNNFPNLYKKPQNELNYLFEGDATLIENNLAEKYYPNWKAQGDFLILPLEKLFFPNEEDYYRVGEEILRKKFNNGKNRKGINKLYKKSVEDILGIFELNNH